MPQAMHARLGREQLVHGDECFTLAQWSDAAFHYEKALEWLREAGDSADAEERRIAGLAWVGLGRVHLKQGDARRAMPLFLKAHALIPEAWEPLYWKGCAEGWCGDLEAAEASFTMALSVGPAQGCVYLQRGHTRYKRRCLDAALDDYLAASRYGGIRNGDYTALAALRVERGEFEEAGDLLVSPPHEPENEPLLAVTRGWYYERQGDLEQAAAAYAGMHSTDSATASLAAERLGITLSRMGDCEKALTTLKAALDQGGAAIVCGGLRNV